VNKLKKDTNKAGKLGAKKQAKKPAALNAEEPQPGNSMITNL